MDACVTCAADGHPSVEAGDISCELCEYEQF